MSISTAPATCKSGQNRSIVMGGRTDGDSSRKTNTSAVAELLNGSHKPTSPQAVATTAVVTSLSKQMRQYGDTAAAAAAAAGQQVFQAAAKHRQVAPLASLDCSITEPITDAAGSPGANSHSATDTPTLSGYFDCDQLSDMVDDSLFEITTAGCLSKSVFNSDFRERQLKSNSSCCIINKQVSNSGLSSALVVAGEENSERVDSRTPTNEEPSNNQSHQDNNNSYNNKQKLNANHQQGQKQADGEAHMTLLANNNNNYYYNNHQHQHQHQPQHHQRPQHTESRNRYQVSSSSDIQTPAVGNLNGHRQRSKSAKFSTATAVASSSSFMNETGDEIIKMTPPAGDAQHRVRRKTRSNPDVRADGNVEAGGALACPVCRQNGTSSSSSTATLAANKKGKNKKKFTFSLFNLFTSNAGDNQPSVAKREAICQHHGNPSKQLQATTTTTTTTTTGGGQKSSLSNGEQSRHAPTNRRGHRHRFFESSTNNAGIGTHIKSRDSIKLTNQRKKRNNAVRLSTSYNNFQDEPTELLLDFSGQATAASSTISPQQSSSAYQERPTGGGELRLSQSSSNIRLKDGHQTISGSGSSDGSLLMAPNGARLLQRQTKSVKFTTPDRVMMILPTSLNKSSAGFHCSNLPPPADRQPSAPIIKRPAPKASSYSQTESNKGLLELLAKYEGNTELIVEINEKLKLTETIASPISTLDQVIRCSRDGDDDDDGDGDDDDQVGDDDDDDDENLSRGDTDSNRQVESTKTSGEQTACCQPETLITKQNSSEPEKVSGFSVDWTTKQRALV